MSEPVENLEPPDPTPIPTPLEAALYPDSCAAWTVTVTPGSASAKVLALLDPVRMCQAGRVDALVGLERLVAWAQAGQTRVLAAMADDPFSDALAPSLERDWVKEDVRAALGESSLGATARLRDAAQLVHDLSDTLDALEQGRIRIGPPGRWPKWSAPWMRTRPARWSRRCCLARRMWTRRRRCR